MTDCTATHPERPEVECQKDQPGGCTHFHINYTLDVDWDAPVPDPKRRRTAEMQAIAENTPRPATTGPPSLATTAHARTTDPATSHRAAASLTNLRPAQEEVLALFRKYGPMIDEEMLSRAGDEQVKQTPSGLRTRRSELVEAGLMVDSGEQRPTPSGHNAIVWVAVTLL